MKKNFELDLMQEIFNDDYCSIYEVLLLHTGINRNGFNISKDAVIKSLPSFFNKPLYALLDNNFNKSNSKDFTNHYMDDDALCTMNYNVEDVCIFGVIPESAPMEWIEKDGREYLKTQAIVWKNYCGVINDILQRRDGNVKVSIEIFLEEYEKQESGIVDINKFKFLCVTMLGADVMEGIQGSSIKSLKFSQKQLNDRFIDFSQNSNKSNIINSIMSKYSLIEKEALSLQENKDIEFSVEDYGKGKTIKVKKGKDDMSTGDWGNVDKIALRNKVLNAKNYKSLVNDVYALVEDGWEEAPSEHLKYPIMEIKSDVAVYNRYGLAAALAYASKENETSVISKVESLYKKLEINDTEGGEKKMEKENEIKNENLELKNEEVKNESNLEVKNEEITDEKEIKNETVKEEDFAEKEEDVKTDDKEEEIEKECKNELEENFEEKFNSLVEEMSLLKEKLQTYERAEEEKQMSEMIDKFAHCMSEDKIKELKNSITASKKEDMEKLVNSEIANFALSFSKKEEEKEDKIEFSINPLYTNLGVDFSHSNGKSTLDNIIADKSVKIGNE